MFMNFIFVLPCYNFLFCLSFIFMLYSQSPVVGHSIIDNLQTNHYNNQNIISTCISGALSVLSFTQMDNHDSRSNGPIDELQQLREELHMTKSKMAEWEGVYNQAKRVCLYLWSNFWLMQTSMQSFACQHS